MFGTSAVRLEHQLLMELIFGMAEEFVALLEPTVQN